MYRTCTCTCMCECSIKGNIFVIFIINFLLLTKFVHVHVHVYVHVGISDEQSCWSHYKTTSEYTIRHNSDSAQSYITVTIDDYSKIQLSYGSW